MSKDGALPERLSFMKLDTQAQANIRSIKPLVMAELPGALDAFYAQVQSFPETRAFFPNATLVSSAKGRQLAHWELISAGQFDNSYLSAVTKVGETHARIGLEPRWYIGGYALVLESLVSAVLKSRWPKKGFGARGSASIDQVAGELGAVIKATLLDMDLAISVYLEASDTARKQAEDRAKATSEAVMSAVGRAVGALADGDMTYRIGDDMPDEYGRLRDDFN
ncbi:MAG TPA: protoglobin domain-containing protein, partial [Caulobacteraceae bacterium]|nr:protoglobin domain-containing protein [Caulobacteraceae bacterium]